MDNQQPTQPTDPSQPQVFQPQPQVQVQPQQAAVPPQPTNANYVPAAAPVPQKQVSKSKRVVSCIAGVLLVLFALSIVQGQLSHSFDIFGIIMILFFGGIGLTLLYTGIFANRQK